MNKTPDEIVAESIIEKVKGKTLIRTEDIESFSKKFKNGLLSEEDWRIFAEGKHIEKVNKNEQKNK